MRWIFLALTCVAGFAAAAPSIDDFEKDIRPILEKNCYECHSSEKHKGGFNLAAYEMFEDVKACPDVFATALERLQAFEMPPEGSKIKMSSDTNLRLQRFFR